MTGIDTAGEWLLLTIVGASILIAVKRVASGPRARNGSASGEEPVPGRGGEQPTDVGARLEESRAVAVLEGDLEHPRLRCECCGYLTREVPRDRLAPDPRDAVSTCPFCDWENPSVCLDGKPVPGAAPAVERNGGYTLEQARANVHQYLWMYDPARPEPWMSGPPTAQELDIKRDLRGAYGAIDRDPGDHAAWNRVLGGEAALRKLARRRVKSLQNELWRKGRGRNADG